LHQRTVASRDAKLLISSAIFDPNHPQAEGKTKPGLQNIVAVRHLWMDFENGDLRPEEIAKLFPLIRLVVFNTYNHSKEAPRFRVVIPFDYPISPDNYIAYDNVIAKFVDAGYSVGKSRGGKRSGLDVSKKSPASLFYLPSQPKNPAESFFKDYNDDNRRILDPMKWIENSVVQFPKLDDARRNTLQTSPKTIDQAAVEKATTTWRESPKYPGEGNDRFFRYALALRSAEMSLEEIESRLRSEATFGRSPHKGRARIPSIMKTLRAPLKKSA
jgi:hypothetical protein